jgi:hypothetical protein
MEARRGITRRWCVRRADGKPRDRGGLIDRARACCSDRPFAPRLAAFPVTAFHTGQVISAGHLAFLAVATVDVNNFASGQRSGRWLLTEGPASGLDALSVSLRRSAWDSSGAPLLGSEPVLCHTLERSCTLRLSSQWSEQDCCKNSDKQFVHMRFPSPMAHRSVIRKKKKEPVPPIGTGFANRSCRLECRERAA